MVWGLSIVTYIGIETDVGFTECGYLSLGQTGFYLEISNESILNCSLLCLVAGVLLSVGNVQRVSATNDYE